VAVGADALSQESEPKPFPETKVASVDVVRVMRDARVVREATDKSRREAAALSAKQAPFAERLKQWREELELCEPGTKDWQERDDLITKTLWTLNSERAYLEQKAGVRMMQVRVKLVTGMEKAIESYSASRGIDVVVMKNSTEIDMKTVDTPEKLLAYVSSRPVLHTSAKADITTEILDLLDGN
jgi:hypothetical protein